MTEPEFFHVSSSMNRTSIYNNGLDVSRMGAARGIAGSREPEEDGCFIACGAHEREWFTRMNNTGGPVDVWRVHDIDVADLVTSRHGYRLVPGKIAAARLILVENGAWPANRR